MFALKKARHVFAPTKTYGNALLPNLHLGAMPDVTRGTLADAWYSSLKEVRCEACALRRGDSAPLPLATTCSKWHSRRRGKPASRTMAAVAFHGHASHCWTCFSLHSWRPRTACVVIVQDAGFDEMLYTANVVWARAECITTSLRS